MSEKKNWIQTELTCKPLDSLEEVDLFLQDPPAWRSLCRKITPHSRNVVRNCDVNKLFGENTIETPQSFCHLDTEAKDVERHDGRNLPKTLVCHDMANGYHEDRFVNGAGGAGAADAYSFYNWAAVDVFCYFSHHLVTVPPLGWINVAHDHGVKVLGTVITEWAQGAALWERVLATEADSQRFASALVAIAGTLRFDGWLLNVENKVAKPRELLRFVRQLHAALHRELDEPLLIWYDSVTVEGELNWQNGLNEKNMEFFDAVDGLFTNYAWAERDVAASAAAAGARRAALYVGVDVWGRNFYGGGQLNTRQAIKVAYDYGCSVAIFAQAWTHEALSEDAGDANTVANSDDLDRYEKFLLRDRALWCSIWPYLNTKLPKALPFQTSFCRGRGKRRWLYGEVICPVPWYNLRHMQYQPNSALGPHGYLLSSRDNIDGLARLGLLANGAGVLRCRRSNNADAADGSTSEVSITAKSDSLTIVTQEQAVEVTSNETETSADKTKVIDVLRNLFKVKRKQDEGRKRKLSSDDEEETKTVVQDKEDTDAIDSPEISERAMVQMSVLLRLGEKAVRTQYALAYVSRELECLEPFFEDGFLGGCCLKINPSDEASTEHRLSRLFHCDFVCEDGLIACVVTKQMAGHEHQFLNVRLHVQDGDGTYRKLVLVGRDGPRGADEAAAAETDHLYPLSDPNDPEFRDIQKYMVLNEQDFYVSVANAYGWNVRYYQIELGGSRVTSVTARAAARRGPILLGYFGLCGRRAARGRGGP